MNTFPLSIESYIIGGTVHPVQAMVDYAPLRVGEAEHA
jgi:hypothetical protein